MFASIPALLVLLLSPLLSLVERSTGVSSNVGKLSAGLTCTALAFGLLAGVAYLGEQPVSYFWLLCAMALLTLGEMRVIPATLAMVSQLAPAHRTATALALFYAVNAVGLFCSGLLGGLWEYCPKVCFFSLLALAPLIAAGLVLMQSAFIARPGCRLPRPHHMPSRP